MREIWVPLDTLTLTGDPAHSVSESVTFQRRPIVETAAGFTNRIAESVAGISPIALAVFDDVTARRLAELEGDGERTD